MTNSRGVFINPTAPITGLEESIKKIQRKQNRVSRHMKLLIAWILTTTLFTFIGWQLGKWFENNTIVVKTPVVIYFQRPVRFVGREVYKQEQEMAHQTAENKRKAIEEYLNPSQKEKCSSEVMERINPKKFFSIISKYESNDGKDTNPKALHNYCKNKGMYNNIGYNPQGKFCFNDQEEAELFVAYYIKKNCGGKTMESCLCFWNLGKWVNECPYSKGNLSQSN